MTLAEGTHSPQNADEDDRDGVSSDDGDRLIIVTPETQAVAEGRGQPVLTGWELNLERAIHIDLAHEPVSRPHRDPSWDHLVDKLRRRAALCPYLTGNRPVAEARRCHRAGGATRERDGKKTHDYRLHPKRVRADLIDKTHRVAEAVPGVVSVGDIRARWHGHRLLIDLVAAVDPDLLVRHGHEIGQTITHELIHAFDFNLEVLVHIDPSDDPRAHELTAHHR